MLIDNFGGLSPDIGSLDQKFRDFYKKGNCIRNHHVVACLATKAMAFQANAKYLDILIKGCYQGDSRGSIRGHAENVK